MGECMGGVLEILVIIIALILALIVGMMLFLSSTRIVKHVGIVNVTGLDIGSTSWAKVVVLVDNNANPNNSLLDTAWGLSILVEVPGKKILFDTGPNPYVLEHNAKILNANLSDVDIIVISHEHGDHVGGLKLLPKVNKRAIVYIPKHMWSSVKRWIEGLGFKTFEVTNTTKICDGVAVLGEIYGPPYEIALVVNVEGLGSIIVVGCSHPGVENIVGKAVKELNVKPYAVIGGFHLAGASKYKLESTVRKLLEYGVEKIYPIHCSGEGIRDLLESEYPQNYGDGFVGLVLEFKSVG